MKRSYLKFILISIVVFLIAGFYFKERFSDRIPKENYQYQEVKENGTGIIKKETTKIEENSTTTEPKEDLTPRQVVERFIEADTLGTRLGGEIAKEAPNIENYRSSKFMDPGWDIIMVIKNYEIVDEYLSKEGNSYFVKVKYFCKEGIASGFSGAKDEKVIMTTPSDVPGGEGIIVSFNCDSFFSPLADPSIIKYDFGFQTETITFGLIKEEGRWKIDSPLSCPRISEETLKKHLEDLSK
ncbi:MAG: hypothetical protein ACKKMW_00290 [Candidatus Nealsonbacteria bacterium]